jgi:hypothetical protein
MDLDVFIGIMYIADKMKCKSGSDYINYFYIIIVLLVVIILVLLYLANGHVFGYENRYRGPALWRTRGPDQNGMVKEREVYDRAG